MGHGPEFQQQLEDIRASEVANDATPGVWTALIAANPYRHGFSVQNKHATAVLSIFSSTAQPSSGTQPGEIDIAAGVFFQVPFGTLKKWWVRSTVTVTKATLWEY